MSDNSERRRASRIQGGWAKPTPKANPVFPRMNQEAVKYEEDKNYVFREKPLPIEYADDGQYELSASEHGVSKVRLLCNFLSKQEADMTFKHLKKEIPWQHRVNEKYNSEEPRLSCWIGEHPYTYSGVSWQAHPFTPTTEMLRDKLEKEIGFRFNSVLCNLYRNCKDGIGWHADNEPMLGKNPFIASISLGETRTFEMRRKLLNYTSEADYDYAQIYKFPLTHGSLLIMDGATQADWQHQVPKEYHDKKPRINLTFRKIYPNNV